MDETMPIVEKDVVELRKELDRQGQEGKPHIPKKWMYLLGVITLLFAMFVFGLLTKPDTQQGEISVVQAVLDKNAPLVVQPEFGQRIQALYAAASVGTALIPTEKSEAVTPKILTWTPPNKEQVNEDLPPISGRYEIPSGWFGRVRLLSDGKEIGSVSVDARTADGDKGYQGTFSFTPKRSTLGKQVGLGFDAVESCRLVCSPADILCQKKHKTDFCLARANNQSFLLYVPTSVVNPMVDNKE